MSQLGRGFLATPRAPWLWRASMLSDRRAQALIRSPPIRRGSERINKPSIAGFVSCVGRASKQGPTLGDEREFRSAQSVPNLSAPLPVAAITESLLAGRGDW